MIKLAYESTPDVRILNHIASIFYDKKNVLCALIGLNSEWLQQEKLTPNGVLPLQSQKHPIAFSYREKKH